MRVHRIAIASFGLLLLTLPIASVAADDSATCMRGTGGAAIAACSRIISSGRTADGDIAQVYTLRGMHFQMAAKFADAMADYNKAIQLDPKSALPYSGIGAIFMAKGEYTRAIESLSTGIRLDPGVLTLYSLRGDAYAKKGKYTLAIADYDAAIKLNSSSELALAGRGEAFFEVGDNDRAIADLSEAIRLDPNGPNPYIVRGRSYAKKGDYVRAIADLTTAINLKHPRADVVYLIRADAYENRGNLKEALDDYRKAASSADSRLVKEARVGIERVESKIARTEESASVRLQSSGSGFVVSRRGYILTNYHVVQGCSKLRLNSSAGVNEATIFATDENNDLAILQSRIDQLNALPLREGRSIRQADPVLSVGFPLTGLLSTSANVSMGSVSALAGPHDDSRWLQISAPTQPGNSGGPVLDMSGNVVGVVVATLNAAATLKSEGFIAQNINFAIKSSVARDFLESKGVQYETAISDKKLESGDVAVKGVRSTVRIECYK